MSTVAKEVQVIKATKTGEKAEKIRVAAYCRVSTDKDDQLNSFFAQMRYYTDILFAVTTKWFLWTFMRTRASQERSLKSVMK